MIQPSLKPARAARLESAVRFQMHWLVLLTALGSHGIPAADVIGSIMPPYPAGLTHKVGSCVGGNSTGIARVCDYSIGVLEDSDGMPRILYGARHLRQDSEKRAVWEITDAMPYPMVPEGYILTIAVCEENGALDQKLVAVVRVIDAEWFEDVLLVRRYDLGTGKFVDHPAAGVRCINDGWGL